jgi:CRISPR/Cas system-associated exonuclease Cas4 (RecB family)
MFTIRCSSLPRLLKCSAELRLPQTHTTSAAATEGTRLHDQAVKDYFKGEKNTEYAKYILESEGDQYIEVPVRAIRDNFVLTGTCDFFSYDGETLEVIDLKTGYSQVKPKDNKQLMGYVLGIIETFKIKPTKIYLTIHQGDEPLSHELTQDELKQFEKDLDNINPESEIKAGDHCRFCPSFIHCPAQKDKVLEVVKAPHTINQVDTRNLLLKESAVTKYFKTLKEAYIKEHKEHCKQAFRKVKSWKKGINPPKGNLTPTQALKLGIDCESMIEINETVTYKIV